MLSGTRVPRRPDVRRRPLKGLRADLMTWRRIAPWVILTILALAIVIDLPFNLLGDGVRTRLGPRPPGRAAGHARGRPAERPDGDRSAGRDRARHHRAARRRHRRQRAAGPHPDEQRRHAPDRRRGARRHRREPGAQPRRLHRAAAVPRPEGPDVDRGPGHPAAHRERQHRGAVQRRPDRPDERGADFGQGPARGRLHASRSRARRRGAPTRRLTSSSRDRSRSTAR